MKELRGRNAILTGASRGLGVVIAKTLAREGVNLVLTARSREPLERVRDDVAALGVEAVAVPGDVGNADEREELVRLAEGTLGPVDILVNNAGVETSAPYHEFTPEDIEEQIRVNLLAPMLLVRSLLPGMVARNAGAIVNVASLAGKGAFPYETPYSVAKAGLVKLSHTLAAELDSTAVTVSAVCPGFVSEAGMYARVEEEGYPAPRTMRRSTPEDVADAVVKAIRTGALELIVNPDPMRPLLAAQELFPSLLPKILRALGVTSYARRVATERKNEVI